MREQRVSEHLPKMHGGGSYSDWEIIPVHIAPITYVSGTRPLIMWVSLVLHGSRLLSSLLRLRIWPWWELRTVVLLCVMFSWNLFSEL